MTTDPESAKDQAPEGVAAGAPPALETEAQLAALRTENQRLQNLVTASAPSNASVEYLKARSAGRVRGWRWVAAVIVFILAAFVAPLAVTGVWVKAQVFDTDRYVATVTPLASNPGVQQAIANEITEQIYAHVDIDKIVTEGLGVLVTKGVPSQLEGLAPVISSGIKSFLSDQVLKLVQSDLFEKAWVTANTQAHTALVAALTGNTGGTVSVQNNEVSIDLGAFIASIKPQLVAAGVPFAASIPTIDATFVIFKSDNIGEAQAAASYLNTIGSVLPIVALVLLLAGIFIAPNRRRGLIVAASTLLVGMALLAAALALGRGWYITSLPGGILNTQTAGEVFDTVAVQLTTAIRTLCVFAIIIIIAALLAGPSRASVWIRSGLQTGNQLIRKMLKRQDLPPTSVEVFVGRYGRVFEWVFVLIAFLIILLTTQPSTAFIVWMAILVLVLVVIVELLGVTQAQASSPGPEAGLPAVVESSPADPSPRQADTQADTQVVPVPAATTVLVAPEDRPASEGTGAH